MNEMNFTAGKRGGRGDFNYLAYCRLSIVDWKKFPLPSGERIKVRGDKYIVDCRLPIVN